MISIRIGIKMKAMQSTLKVYLARIQPNHTAYIVGTLPINLQCWLAGKESNPITQHISWILSRSTYSVGWQCENPTQSHSIYRGYSPDQLTVLAGRARIQPNHTAYIVDTLPINLQCWLAGQESNQITQHISWILSRSTYSVGWQGKNPTQSHSIYRGYSPDQLTVLAGRARIQPNHTAYIVDTLPINLQCWLAGQESNPITQHISWILSRSTYSVGWQGKNLTQSHSIYRGYSPVQLTLLAGRERIQPNHTAYIVGTLPINLQCWLAG